MTNGPIVTGLTVTISGPHLTAALQAVEYLLELQRRNHVPPRGHWLELRTALTAALSACPHADLAVDTTSQDEWMTTQEAAAGLRCTPRHARRLAPRLSGRQIGGRWLIPTAAVNEHVGGTL